ncbi:hypothetical protein P7K49_017365 [Saguinus oedipus]|uniref:Uncharacterized protein n=1 Tax=Saguinus oedipus TaxID=9490 RepID=A0ABQ9V3F1_SAGOE|nr:hypothetical protein P7K49_017365 [Saguinus oedipus]
MFNLNCPSFGFQRHKRPRGLKLGCGINIQLRETRARRRRPPPSSLTNGERAEEDGGPLPAPGVADGGQEGAGSRQRPPEREECGSRPAVGRPGLRGSRGRVRTGSPTFGGVGSKGGPAGRPRGEHNPSPEGLGAYRATTGKKSKEHGA